MSHEDVSITNGCNLRWKGSYAQAIRGDGADALSVEKLREIVAQADEMGVSFFVIAGGEPLTRPEIVDITRDYPHILFLLITDVLLLVAALIGRLGEQRSTVPVLGIEGTPEEADQRRGRGVREQLREKMAAPREADIILCHSFTATRGTLATVTDPAFLQQAVDRGCKLFFLLGYPPCAKARTSE